MKKRLVSLVLMFAILCSLGTMAFAANGLDNFTKVNSYKSGQFSDVKAGAWYEQSIATAYEMGLVNGMTATTFSPDGNLTIAQTLVLAARLHSIYNTGKAVFTQGTPWYQVYVDYCAKNGIIASGEYSNMSAQATRAQFAKIFAAAIPAEALPAINILEGYEVPDIPMDADYYDAAYLLYGAGILTGSDKYGTFNPQSSIKRSEVATIVTRMADKSQRKTFGEFEQKEITPENMQGVYRSLDGTVELVWSGQTYAVTLKELYDDGSAWYDYYAGYANSGLRQNVFGGEGYASSWVESTKTSFGPYGSYIFIDLWGWGEGYELYRVSSSTLNSEAEKIFADMILPAEKRKPAAITAVDLTIWDTEIFSGASGYPSIYVTIDGKSHYVGSEADFVSISSSNTNVAQVDEYGNLLGIAAGMAEITVNVNSLTDSATLSVVRNPGIDIEYISDRYVYYYEDEQLHRFLFAFKNENYERIKADACVDIRIVNKNSETVYEGSHFVYADSDYDIWTHGSWDGGKLLACVEIYDAAITPGSTPNGTIYYTISEMYGEAYFDEYSLEIDNLPTYYKTASSGSASVEVPER